MDPSVGAEPEEREDHAEEMKQGEGEGGACKGGETKEGGASRGGRL